MTRSLPHKPDVSNLTMRHRILQKTISDLDKGRDAAIESENTKALAHLAEQRFILAEFDCFFEQPPARIVDGLRRAMEDLRTAFELGHRTNAWHLWDYFTYALAAGDRASAHAMASLPEELWWDPGIKPTPWLIVQCQAAFALLREEDAAALVQKLRGLVFESPLPPAVADETAQIQAVCRLLEALQKRSLPEFEKGLEQLFAWHAAYFARTCNLAPVSLADLHAVGLVRLARDRGMSPTFRNPYLPLELLDVPAPREAAT